MDKQDENTNQQVHELVEQLKPLINQIERINEQAVITYTPLVEDICSRKATENEVDWLLTWLLDFAGNEQMLGLYKKVCRAYWKSYPETVAFYIMEYRILYDPESLIGTEYEYMLNKYDD